MHAGVHPAGLLLQEVLRTQLVADLPVVALQPRLVGVGRGTQRHGPRGLVPVDDEGGVPHGRAGPGLLRREEVHPQGPHQRADVGDPDPDVLALAECTQQSGDVLLPPPLPPVAAEPLRDEHQDLGLGGDGQVVLRQDHLHELNGQLAPPRILCNGAQVPALAQGCHELLAELLLIRRVERREVVEGEEDVRVEVVLDVLQTQVNHLVYAVLVREHEQAGHVDAADVHLVRVDEADQLHELVARLRNHHLARQALPEGGRRTQHLVEVGVLREDQGVAAQPHGLLPGEL
mmetsp:Transcript_38141/g.119003  ORF Transcript_38141/g.119003 Transcript_38141/m.119003 type:complete len:289 (+) Transcript_38141:780-1646(+)